MNNVVRCVGIPVLVVIIFFLIGSRPIYGLGIQTRGLITFLITWVGLMVGLLMINAAFKGKLQGEGLDYWKMTGALILAVPALIQVVYAH